MGTHHQPGLRLFGSTTEVAASCRGLRVHLERERLATPEEIARIWPADEDESGEPWSWVYAYGQLQRLLGRAAAPDGEEGAVERAALAVLHEEPVTVLLSDGERVQVWPKGFRAIAWMDARDGYAAWLAERRAAWEVAAAAGTAPGELPMGPHEIVERTRMEEVRVLARMAAQACSEGTRLRREIPEEEVERYTERSPLDLLRILQEYREVNGARLAAARMLVPEGSTTASGERASWAVLQARTADRYRSDPTSIADDRSLAALLLTVELAAPAAADVDLEDALS